ncbi:Ig-like domain-containing protein [Saccharibacillus kuerlensis]|uniref:SLH domain-containing protein n=1 Tax=Saccharibacillus kuerlensis TaxID=459527 RepID=A0ABQ2KVY5_9BACL|nr:Ig-like domain-containing protein [Saccharibacillus kuerlensis]GGN94888.1 hypothetical protein GCM10010969_10050 [Saccharibacillus kuerlensis]
MHFMKKIGRVLLAAFVMTGPLYSKHVNHAYAASPTSTIVVSDTSLKIGETAIVTITFSEAVSGFTASDLESKNASISNLSSFDGGVTWTAVLTPNANIKASNEVVTLNNADVQNSAQEWGTGTTVSNAYSIDTIRPSLMSGITISDTVLAIGDSAAVTLIFTEAVVGFTAADLIVPNGTISNLATLDGGVTWTATLVPNAAVTDSNNVITLDYAGVMDMAGNAGSGTTVSSNYAIDTIRPTAEIVVSDSFLNSGETAQVTITFSEAITGFTKEDLTVDNGTISDLSSSDGGTTWTATLTPAANTQASTNIMTLDNLGIMDLAGNIGTGTTPSNDYAVDTVRPMAAAITLSDTSLAIGETADVTFVFSEAIVGFTKEDLTVGNGTISDPSSGDGGTTWTATLTSAVDVEASVNTVTLDNSGIAGQSGNTGTGKTDSDNYAVDTIRPTATVAVTNTTLKSGTTSPITITFSEAVTGLTIEDLTAGKGTLSGLSTLDGGITWTAILTPTTDVESSTNVIVLDNAGAADLAGNSGEGAINSNNYSIHTVVPTAVVAIEDSTLTAGESSRVTITFSEAVTDFTNNDLTVESGTLSSVTSADGGITWTATFTPQTNVSAAVNYITLQNDGVTNLTGNPGIGTTKSNVYAVLTVTAADGNSSLPSDSPAFTMPSFEGPTVSTNGHLTLPAGRSGTVGLGEEISMTIPAGASLKELKLTIQKVSDTQSLLTNNEILASPVFELLKNSLESFRKPVTLSLAFDRAVLNNEHTAAVFYYDETKREWIQVESGTVGEHRITVEVDHLAKYAVLAVDERAEAPVDGNTQEAAIRDLSGHWAEEIVRRAIHEGIVAGYPDGTFEPDSIVTRAEFSVMLMNVLNGEEAGAALNFTDTAEIGVWAQQAVSQALQAGIVTGYSDGSFRPYAHLTRAEMAVMAAKALKLPAGNNAETPFADDKAVPAWAKGSAAALKNAGVIRGTSTNKFNPRAQTTRAEAVVVLINVLKLLEKK